MVKGTSFASLSIILFILIGCTAAASTDQAKLGLDVPDRDLERGDRHLSLVARALQTFEHLSPIEGLTEPRGLHDHDRHLLDPLIRGEPAVALGALAPATDGVLRLGDPRLDDSML